MAEANFSHCLFNLLVFYTNARFNLRKTNAANEGLVGRLSLGRLVLYAGSQTDCRSHSNSLSNKTDNILTGYQDYYPSVIVVVRWPLKNDRRPGSPCRSDTEYPFARRQRDHTLLACPPGEGNINGQTAFAACPSSLQSYLCYEAVFSS